VENGRLLSEMDQWISDLGELICYADDSGMWYEITADNRNDLVQGINADLQSLLDWGLDNKTTFEADKTAMMLVSNKKVPFDLSGIKMGGFPVKQEKATQTSWSFVRSEDVFWSNDP
jgi:hypothetical protein